MKKNLSKIATIAAVLILIIPIVGCGNKSTTPTTAQGEKTIAVWGPFDDQDVFQPIMKDFMNQNKGYKAEYKKIDFSQYDVESLLSLAAQKGPDIWLIPNDWLGRHLDKFLPLPDGLLKKNKKDATTNEDYVKQNFVPVVADQVIKDGQVYALPMYMDTLALYYNKDIFRQKTKEIEKSSLSNQEKQRLTALWEKPTDNWTDIIEQVKGLTIKSGDNIQQAGIALGTSNNISRAEDILSLLMLQNGAQMVSPDQITATFNLPGNSQTGQTVYPAQTALDFYTSFANSSSPNYSWNGALPNSFDYFTQGKVAMMIDYGYRTNEIQQKAPTLNFKTQALPQIKGASQPIDYPYYLVAGVTKSSSNQELAWQLVKDLTTGSANSSYLSASQRLSAKKPQEEVPMAKRSESSNPFKFQGATAKTWYKGRYPQEVDMVMGKMIDRVTVEKMAVNTAVEEAAQKITELLRKGND